MSTVNQEATNEQMRFGFGANWADYVKTKFSDERVAIAQKHLLNFLKLSDLRGKTFLDIGCGSGIHSLAAWQAGAEKVFSFDYDPNSVATTRWLSHRVGNPANWTAIQGSILDQPFVDRLPKADIVYSWGVLHHTGSMWEAVANATRCLAKGGVFYVALYSKDVYVSPPYHYWLDVKRKYNQAGLLTKKIMEWKYAWNDCIKTHLKQKKNPFAYMSAYKYSRGMSYWHDVKDWLGGYPMEFAGHRETEEFVGQLGLELIHVKAGEGNTEYLFRHKGAISYWDAISERNPPIPIHGPFESFGGFAWRATLPKNLAGEPTRFMLYENDIPIGWANCPLSMVQGYGCGRYTLESDVLIFSTTDNQDPNVGKQFYFRPNFI